MGAATLVRALPDWETDTGLYRLSPPLLVHGEAHRHVIVSTLPRHNGAHGSLVFAADAGGSVTSWHWLHRSDADNHAEALGELGYEVVSP